MNMGLADFGRSGRKNDENGVAGRAGIGAALVTPGGQVGVGVAGAGSGEESNFTTRLVLPQSLRDGAVVALFDTMIEAASYAQNEFPDGLFSLRKVDEQA